MKKVLYLVVLGISANMSAISLSDIKNAFKKKSTDSTPTIIKTELTFDAIKALEKRIDNLKVDSKRKQAFKNYATNLRTLLNSKINFTAMLKNAPLASCEVIDPAIGQIDKISDYAVKYLPNIAPASNASQEEKSLYTELSSHSYTLTTQLIPIKRQFIAERSRCGDKGKQAARIAELDKKVTALQGQAKTLSKK